MDLLVDAIASKGGDSVSICHYSEGRSQLASTAGASMNLVKTLLIFCDLKSKIEVAVAIFGQDRRLSQKCTWRETTGA